MTTQRELPEGCKPHQCALVMDCSRMAKGYYPPCSHPHTPAPDGEIEPEYYSGLRVKDMMVQSNIKASRAATLATLDKIIAYRKAQSKVYGVQTAWEGEGNYILELRQSTAGEQEDKR
jgi:hypothetical protein